MGCWALDELLLLRAEAYLLKKQKQVLRDCLSQWNKLSKLSKVVLSGSRSSSLGRDKPTADSEACLSHAIMITSQEQREVAGAVELGTAAGADDCGNGNCSSRSSPAGPVRETEKEEEHEERDDLELPLVQTLRCLEAFGIDTAQVRAVVETIKQQEKENEEMLSTLHLSGQLDLQRVDDNKIASISKGKGSLAEKIKLSRVIQNMKVLRFKAELLGIDSKEIAAIQAHLDDQLPSRPQEVQNHIGRTGGDFEFEDAGLPVQEITSVSYTGESGKTVYESADSYGNYDDYENSESYSYNSHLRSNMYGNGFSVLSGGDTLYSEDIDDEDSSIFADEQQATSAMDADGAKNEKGDDELPFIGRRAKQLLHSLQNMKNVGFRN